MTAARADFIKALMKHDIREVRQNNLFFEKRTGEVVENKEKLPKNEPERS